MAGEEDLTTDPKKHAIPLSAMLPSASLQLFPGIRHMLHHFVQDEIAQAVDGLFNGIAAHPARPAERPRTQAAWAAERPGRRSTSCEVEMGGAVTRYRVAAIE